MGDAHFTVILYTCKHACYQIIRYLRHFLINLARHFRGSNLWLCACNAVLVMKSVLASGRSVCGYCEDGAGLSGRSAGQIRGHAIFTCLSIPLWRRYVMSVCCVLLKLVIRAWRDTQSTRLPDGKSEGSHRRYQTYTYQHYTSLKLSTCSFFSLLFSSWASRVARLPFPLRQDKDYKVSRA